MRSVAKLLKLYDIYRLRHNNECKRLILRVARDIPRRIDVTPEDLLKAHFKPDEAKREAKKILRSVHVALRGLPHTQSHKLLMKDKLVSLMVYQGPPLLWFTFNPADLYSKIALSAAGVDPENFHQYDKVKDRASKLVDVPQAVVDNFDAHEEAILHTMIMKYGVLGDYEALLEAIEVQERGGPHAHSLLHPPNDFPHATFVPLLETEKLQDTICKFWDSLRISKLYEPETSNVQVQGSSGTATGSAQQEGTASQQQLSDTYWRQDRVEFVEDSERHRWRRFQAHSRSHLEELVPAVQNHTCGTVCLRKQKDGSMKCRFGFPRDVQDSSIFETKDGVQSFSQRQDHPRVNGYSPLILLSGRCNHDLQLLPCSQHSNGVFWYLIKYMSKCDLPESAISQAFSKAHFKAQKRAALADDSDDETYEDGDLIISLANAISSAVTISCPEALRYLSGKDDHSSTHNFQRMPLWILIDSLRSAMSSCSIVIFAFLAFHLTLVALRVHMGSQYYKLIRFPSFGF